MNPTRKHAMILAMEGSDTPTPPAAPPASKPLPESPVGSDQQSPIAPITSDSRRSGIWAFSSIILFVAGVIVAATLINQFVFQSYYVDGTSMTPTLQNNDRLIIDKVERSVARAQSRAYVPTRGQIVVLDSSLIDQSGHNEQLIKRVIGLPGEHIIIGSDGAVMIKNKDNPNGFNANDALGLHLAPAYVDTPIDLVIPSNEVFVMGDNRGPGGSFDSRSFGPIDTSKIEGRLLARIFPLNRTGFF